MRKPRAGSSEPRGSSATSGCCGDAKSAGAAQTRPVADAALVVR